MAHSHDHILGEMKRGHKLDLSHKHAYLPCGTCGKPRWVCLRKGEPQSKYCNKCATKLRSHGDSHNYKRVFVQQADPFRAMATVDGYAVEHRLVMAKHIGRLLNGWEVVHHKNGDKKDNRIENLELISDSKYHLIDMETKKKVRDLERQVERLQEEIKKLRGEKLDVPRSS